ncbi:MAG: Fic family protein [Lachnospiraceae bacterium]|nr:Fic family protein [Lachnospiraceae bacterium]
MSERYDPPYIITDKMLIFVGAVSEKAGKMAVYGDLSSKPLIRERNRSLSIASTLKISPKKPSEGTDKSVIPNPSEEDMKKRLNKLCDSILKLDPTNIEDLIKSYDLMAGLDENNRDVFNNDNKLSVNPSGNRARELTEDLLAWLKANKGRVHPLILSSVFHYEFILIQPFRDNNDKMARFWQKLILSDWNRIFDFLPFESQIDHFQKKYFSTITKCHAKGNSTDFIEFILEMTDRALDELITEIDRANAGASRYVKRMLSLMEYETPYSSNEIMKKLKLKSKETLRKNYLNPALDLGLIRMTLPDKRKSRNQSYVKQ